jgi:hypothetical protein
MNSSFFTSDRATHIKTVLVALVASTVVALVIIKAQMSQFAETRSASAQNWSDGGVVKAGKPARYSILDKSTIR